MSNKRIVLAFVLCLLTVLGLTALSGCNASGYEITWSVEFDKEASDNAVITVEGYKELPSKILRVMRLPSPLKVLTATRYIELRSITVRLRPTKTVSTYLPSPKAPRWKLL